MTVTSNMTVALAVDTSQFVRAMQKVALATADLGHTLRRVRLAYWRSTLTPGETHIDRIVRECIAERDWRRAEVRLLAACDLGLILDRGAA